MSKSINLVSTNLIGLEKERKRLKIFRGIAVACLIIVSLMSVLAFVLNVTLPIESVKKQQQNVITSISFFHKKLTEYTLLNDRVKNISSLISKRKDYGPQVNEIFNNIPADVSTDSLNIQIEKLSMTVSSTSLLSINKFINDMVVLGVKGKTINNVVLQGLTLDVSSGKYSLNLQANLP